jgi:peptidylprolyl isomerase
MSKTPMNRARRRREARQQSVPKPSFWSTPLAVALVGIAVFLGVVGTIIAWRQMPGSTSPSPTNTSATAVTAPATNAAPTSNRIPANTNHAAPAGELKIEDLTVGTGPSPKPGDRVTVNYSGTLTDGTKFDSSYDRNQPFTFTLGQGSVIKGWDQGVATMKVGGKRKLTIPPSLGYGAQDKGKIPPNSTLLFDIELLKIEPTP